MRKTNRTLVDEFGESSSKNVNFDDIVASKKLDKKFKAELKEIIMCLLFIGMTMTLSYQMIDNGANSYRNNLMNIFGAGSINTQFNSVKIFISNISI